MTTLLAMDRVTSYYGKTPILKNFTFGLEQGKCLCVLGRNGVGKTTLMRTIMGLTDRSSGDITLSGQAIGAAPTYERAKLGIGPSLIRLSCGLEGTADLVRDLQQALEG